MTFSIRNILNSSVVFGLLASMVSASMIENCKPNHVAITYDDGPYDFTLALVNLLNSKNVKATFFVNGKNFIDLESNQEGQKAIKKAYETGHQIASHTLSHKDLDVISGEEFDSEITELERIVHDLIGVKPAFIRPPYGNANEDTVSKLESRGYSVIKWSTDTKDYDTHDLQQEMANVKNSFNSSSSDEGYITLSHDVYEQTTTELTEALIEYTKSQGFEFATVADCIGKSPYQ
ncbi:chitin deacetylase [Mucor ambiguus]|uniref:Chitin deacetylase n=1 Tax=Mucor ambiguus TaxID=91626 RepID=A0A0C9LVZ4_9FUNG|nr:chitin deacetylase [Mucor ambiguus]